MMSNPAAVTRDAAIDVRFGQVGLVQVRIRTTDPGAILDELTGRIAASPGFFERTAVCLDLSALDTLPAPAEVRTVIGAVRRAGMMTVGLLRGSTSVDELAAALELPVLMHFSPQARPAAVPAPVVVPTLEPVGLPALMQHQTVRSGQRLYARQRDLVVTAAVGAGAEVIADGCVHIYAALRGRAIAGARGDTSARVFCQAFHAELVSIAGVFRVFETLPAHLAGQPVQAWLDGDQLMLTRIID